MKADYENKIIELLERIASSLKKSQKDNLVKIPSIEVL